MPKIYFDAVPGTLKSPVGKRAAQTTMAKWIEQKKKDGPEMIKRYMELDTFFAENFPYIEILIEARELYINGFFYSTVAMVGIAAERFAIDLLNASEIIVNGKKINNKDTFKDIEQYRRLKLLLSLGILDRKSMGKLSGIKDIRNRYAHGEKYRADKKDALTVLRLFTDVINSEFFKKYEFRKGGLALKKI